MERLRKRRWKPAVDKETRKWFTGWQGEVDADLGVVTVDEPHKMQTLHLTPCGMSRDGAMYYTFKDKDDHTYDMSMSGSYALFCALAAGIVKTSDQVYSGWALPCVQTKQGAHYFIEVFYVDGMPTRND